MSVLRLGSFLAFVSMICVCVLFFAGVYDAQDFPPSGTNSSNAVMQWGDSLEASVHSAFPGDPVRKHEAGQVFARAFGGWLAIFIMSLLVAGITVLFSGRASRSPRIAGSIAIIALTSMNLFVHLHETGSIG